MLMYDDGIGCCFFFFALVVLGLNEVHGLFSGLDCTFCAFAIAIAIGLDCIYTHLTLP